MEFKSFSRRGWIKNLIYLLEKRSFYLIMAISLLIIGVTAFYVTSSNVLLRRSNSDNFSINSQGQVAGKNGVEFPSKVSSIGSDFDDRGNSAKVDQESKAVAASKVIGDIEKPEDKATAKPPVTSFDVKPIDGKVLTEYAKDTLVFSNMLSEWRAHLGIDIEGILGSPVRAVCEGVVCDVKEDPEYGFTVIVDHGSGLKTVYSNLAKSDIVKKGQKVEKEANIGAIGNTAAFEAIEKTHLHFEVLQNEEQVDPNQFYRLN